MDDEVITAIGDLAAFERQDRQVGAIPEGPNVHPPTIAPTRWPGVVLTEVRPPG